MKVKYIGNGKENYLVKDNYVALTPGKVYEVIKIHERFGWYCIHDDSGDEELYAYPTEFFEVVEE